MRVGLRPARFTTQRDFPIQSFGTFSGNEKTAPTRVASYAHSSTTGKTAFEKLHTAVFGLIGIASIISSRMENIYHLI